MKSASKFLYMGLTAYDGTIPISELKVPKGSNNWSSKKHFLPVNLQTGSASLKKASYSYLASFQKHYAESTIYIKSVGWLVWLTDSKTRLCVLYWLQSYDYSL